MPQQWLNYIIGAHQGQKGNIYTSRLLITIIKYKKSKPWAHGYGFLPRGHSTLIPKEGIKNPPPPYTLRSHLDVKLNT